MNKSLATSVALALLLACQASAMACGMDKHLEGDESDDVKTEKVVH